MESGSAQVVVDNAARIYKPLYSGQDVHDQQREIRVLTLSPNPNREAKIECTLRKVALKERTPYMAISYLFARSSYTMLARLLTAAVHLLNPTRLAFSGVDELCFFWMIVFPLDKTILIGISAYSFQ